MEKESGTLEELLNVRVVLELKKLARLLTGVKLPTRKADIIAIIVREMTEYTRDYWDILDDLQQKAVAEALYAPWFDEGGFYAKYGAEPDWGDTPSWSEYTHEPSLLHLFIMSGDRYGYYGGQKVVPDDLKVILKKFVPKPPPAKLRVETKRPESVEVPQYNFLTGKEKIKQIPLYHADTERTAQEDLMSVLRLVDAGKVRVSERTGRPSAATVRIIGEALWGGDFYPDREKRDKWEELPGPIKAHAWPMLIHAAKLARLKSGKLQLTPAGRKAFDAPPHETIKTLWRAWLKNAKTDELQRVNAIRGQTTVDGKSGMTSTVKRRDVIVKALKKCPVEKWFGFGDFFDFMRASNYLLIVSNEPWALFIQDEYGHLTDGWALLASQYTQVFLFEYAATLGLIDVAYIDPVDSPDGDYEADIAFLSRYDGLMCLRINALGAFCLGRKRSYTPSEVEIERVLKVLPNFDVVAFKPLPSGDQIALEQFAEKTADNVWKIRPEQMLKGLESGQSLDHMRSFLKHKSGEALPQPVAVLFDDMADKVPRLRAKGTAHLIEVTDVETAQF
ncbi:MAG: hypothetical protein OXC45_06830, partial [Gemmatimonadetes bacterium]|nr:hypothetical protein [Gemmatimonadota bacterium]